MLLRSIIFAFFIIVQLIKPVFGEAPLDAREQELATAFREGGKVAIRGGAIVPLLGQAQLTLPRDYTFVPQPQAARIMRALGNTEDPALVGLVFPSQGRESWLVEIRYVASGYIKDDEAKDWKAESLLENIRSGTEIANKDRVARGFEQLEVLGWAEPPTYDALTHRLIWAAINREKNIPNSVLGVNYNTYALGREGYFGLNLLTSAEGLSTDKKHSRVLLAALEYNNGKSYDDFNSSTDNVAAYGITALVAGIAAKKLGLFAILGVFLAKSAKLLIVAAIAGLVGLKRLFTGRKRPTV
jgi:uncharacterized membrane-anchored protein